MSNQQEEALLQSIRRLNFANLELAKTLGNQNQEGLSEDGYEWLIDEEVRLRKRIKSLEAEVSILGKV